MLHIFSIINIAGKKYSLKEAFNKGLCVIEPAYLLEEQLPSKQAWVRHKEETYTFEDMLKAIPSNHSPRKKFLCIDREGTKIGMVKPNVVLVLESGHS